MSVCPVCGHTVIGDVPDKCPVCAAPERLPDLRLMRLGQARRRRRRREPDGSAAAAVRSRAGRPARHRVDSCTPPPPARPAPAGRGEPFRERRSRTVGYNFGVGREAPQFDLDGARRQSRVPQAVPRRLVPGRRLSGRRSRPPRRRRAALSGDRRPALGLRGQLDRHRARRRRGRASPSPSRPERADFPLLADPDGRGRPRFRRLRRHGGRRAPLRRDRRPRRQDRLDGRRRATACAGRAARRAQVGGPLTTGAPGGPPGVDPGAHIPASRAPTIVRTPARVGNYRPVSTTHEGVYTLMIVGQTVFSVRKGTEHGPRPRCTTSTVFCARRRPPGPSRPAFVRHVAHRQRAA